MEVNTHSAAYVNMPRAAILKVAKEHLLKLEILNVPNLALLK